MGRKIEDNSKFLFASNGKVIHLAEVLKDEHKAVRAGNFKPKGNTTRFIYNQMSVNKWIPFEKRAKVDPKLARDTQLRVMMNKYPEAALELMEAEKTAAA